MNLSTRLSTALWVAVPLILAGFGQGCNVIKSEAEYGDALFDHASDRLGGIVPEGWGEEISVLCNGTDLFLGNVVGDQGAFSIKLGNTTGACVFQDFSMPDPRPGGGGSWTLPTFYYECSDVLGNPDGCTVNVVAGKFTYAYESVLFGFKCMEMESCHAWCEVGGFCPGIECIDCEHECESMLCP